MADRALHPLRARKARELLAGYPARRILVLCHGNICRSPFLQASLAKHLGALGRADIQVSSAGFIGQDRSSPELALSVAREMGFDLRSHRSALLTATDLQRADLVVVMSAGQATDTHWRGAPARTPVVILGDLDTENIGQRTIVDPWNCDESVFRESYRRIDRCAKQLAILVTSNRR
jgi:protein-tyrosine phosphatase